MEAREFLVELQKTQDQFHWEYLPDHCIRGYLKTDKTRHPFHPMTALVFVESGELLRSGGEEKAGELLGLSALDSSAIREAADDLLWKKIDDEMVLDGYVEWFRDGIALAVGLEPSENLRMSVLDRPDGAPARELLVESAT
jgi:hypothetical protein